MQFADVKNDIAFRKIFGNAKKAKILISFLNAVLQLEGDKKVSAVKIENPYQFPRLAGEKASIVDVRATEVSGRQFVVEMQVTEADGFDKRVQYYASRDYSMLNPTVFIGILNFDYFKGSNYLSYHSLLDEKTYESKLKDLRFAFIELPKFNKQEQELVSLIDKWTYFIKKSEKLEMIPVNVDDEGLIEAYLEADKHKWKKKELIAYDNASIGLQDEKGKIIAAEKKAKIEIATKMLRRGTSFEIVAEDTGLNIREVEALFADIKGNT